MNNLLVTRGNTRRPQIKHSRARRDTARATEPCASRLELQAKLLNNTKACRRRRGTAAKPEAIAPCKGKDTALLPVSVTVNRQ
jgi:hypothetical protein